MTLTDFARNKIIDALLRQQSLSAPATFYLALTTTVPTRSTPGTEVSGGSYARVAYTSSLANWSGTQGAGSTTASSGTSGISSNNNTIQFPQPTADWGTIRGVELWDAASGGNRWFFGTVTAVAVNTSTQGPKYNTAQLSLSVDNS